MTYKFDPRKYRSPQRVWDIEKLRFSDVWRTVADFDVELPDGRTIHIPKGFMYDKASVPRIAHAWLPRDDKHILIASLVHDYLYVKQKIEGKWIVRKEADLIFYDLLRQAGMRWTKAHAVYFAVRLGGWTYFNHHAKFKLKNPLYV